MRAPQDDVTHLWSLASERTALGAAALATRPAAPKLGLANFVYALHPDSPGDLEADLAEAVQRSQHVRIVIEPDTPSWVEAELLLRGWQLELEYRLVLPPATGLTGSAAPTDIRPAAEVDADWSERAALFRLDHIEEDLRHRTSPRSQQETDAVVEHRRQLERHATYHCTYSHDTVTGFACSWLTPEGRGVIEDVFVHPEHRKRGLATALLCYAVADLRRAGAGAITIAAEVGDTAVQLYARLGFSPNSVIRSYALRDDRRQSLR
jgi:ribosomal protein S18 acetylase RimI-like enzyme